MSQCGHFCGTRVTADSVTLAAHTFVAPQWSDQASGGSGGSSLVNDTGGPDRSEPSLILIRVFRSVAGFDAFLSQFTLDQQASNLSNTIQ